MTANDPKPSTIATGVSTLPVPQAYLGAASAVRLDDGSTLVYGLSGAGSPGWIRKLDPRGQLDASFAPSGLIPGWWIPPRPEDAEGAWSMGISHLLPTADGRLWSVHQLDWEGIAVTRHLAQGDQDPAFHAQGSDNGLLRLEGSNLSVVGAHVQADGTLALLTQQSTENGTQALELVRVGTAGVLNVTHIMDLDMPAYPGGALLLADGGVLLRFWAKLIRLTVEGALDPLFGADGPTPGMVSQPAGLAPTEAIALADGKLLVAGPSAVAQLGLQLARLNADGTTDTTFDASNALAVLSAEHATSFTPLQLALLSDGRIALATASHGSIEVVRLLADGSLDPSFNPQTEHAGLSRIAVDPDHDITHLTLHAENDGSLMIVGTQFMNALVIRLSADGTLDTTFGPPEGSMQPSQQGDLLVAGETGPLMGYFGLDWADFAGDRAEHTLEVATNPFGDGAAWSIDTQDGDGTQWMSGIERLHFDDVSLALDTGIFVDRGYSAGGFPEEFWDHAGSTAGLVAALWGIDAVEDQALVGEVLSYFDVFGDSVVERLMADPQAFGIEGATAPSGWLRLMYANVTGATPTDELLQQMLARLDVTTPTGYVPTHLQTLEALYQTWFRTSGEESGFNHALAAVRQQMRTDNVEALVFTPFEGPLYGTAGNDSFVSRALSDVFEGDEGLDEALYDRQSSAYTISVQAPAHLEVHGPGASLDILHGIERVRFSDRAIAFDLADGDSANQAVRLVTALAGAEALGDTRLMATALKHMDGSGLPTLVNELVESGLVADYAGGSSIEALVTHLLKNIVGVAPSAPELQWHLGYVQSLGLSTAGILELAVGLDQTAQRADLTGLATQGLVYADPYPYYLD